MDSSVDSQSFAFQSDFNTVAPYADSVYPDILNSNPTKLDVISYVTPLSNGGFIVNSITRKIHCFTPDSYSSPQKSDSCLNSFPREPDVISAILMSVCIPMFQLRC